MAKIGLLFPEEYMVDYAKSIAARQHYEVVYNKRIATSDAVNEARAAVDAGAKVLVARGYQAGIIKQYMSIPVVEIRLTTQELGLLFKRAIALAGKHHPYVALIIFKNMVPNMEHMEELFDVRLGTFFIDYAGEAGNALEKMKDDRPDIIIGGTLVCETARQQGYKTMFYDSTEESIEEAMRSADNMGKALEADKQKQAQFDTVLDTSFNGIIRINRDGEIIVVNRIVEDLLGTENENLIGQKLVTVVPQLSSELIQQILGGEVSNFSTSLNLRDDAWMVLVSPIEYDSQITGAIVSLKRSEESYVYNRRSGQEVVLRGFTADNTFADIDVKSKRLNTELDKAKVYALSSAPIFINTPVGIDAVVVAKAIHNNSNCKAGPFVSLDLDGIPVENQMKALFGSNYEHDVENEQELIPEGAMMKANNGTIYLRNIERLTRDVQHQIVRLLLPWDVIRTDAQKINTLRVRIIASSEKNLVPLVSRGQLEPQLYYALNGLVLDMPPLKDCPEDLTYQFETMLRKKNRKYGKNVHITEGGYKRIRSLPWNGNMLQLDAFTERLVLFSVKRTTDEVAIQKLYNELYPEIKEIEGTQKYVEYRSREGDQIRELLAKHSGNRQAVAKELGVSTTTLWRHMKKYGVESYR